MGKHDLSDKQKLFRTQIGQAATIKREDVPEDKAAIPNRKLCDIGLELNPVPNTLEYKGSAAVHIYQSEHLGQLFFISQTYPLELYRCPEDTACKAFDDLLGTMKERYGKRRPKLRSGF